MPRTDPARIAGVDGARSGWIVASATVLPHTQSLANLTIALAPTFADVLRMCAGFAAVTVDIPIGLLDAAEPGGRPVDRAARTLVGPRRASVFAPPIRAVLDAPDYPAALAISRAASPHALGLSKQCWNIVPKIREVDDALTPALQHRVFEVHPELCFTRMRAAPCAHPKKSAPGRAERLDALAARHITLAEPAESIARRLRALPDDVIDACACLWTAARRARNLAIPIDPAPATDARGLRMEMWV